MARKKARRAAAKAKAVQEPPEEVVAEAEVVPDAGTSGPEPDEALLKAAATAAVAGGGDGESVYMMYFCYCSRSSCTVSFLSDTLRCSGVTFRAKRLS